MTDFAAIKIDGLKELNKALKGIDADAAKTMRLVLNDAGQIVVSVAKPRVPSITGNARASIKVASTQTAVRVKAGGNKAPYYPWLDFGGAVGINKSVKRPFLKSGRYLWAAYSTQDKNIAKLIEKRLHGLVAANGLDVT